MSHYDEAQTGGKPLLCVKNGGKKSSVCSTPPLLKSWRYALYRESKTRLSHGKHH